MMEYVETDCTFEHEGRMFEEGGAVVLPDWITAYITAEREAVGAPVIITDWHGRKLGEGRITARWPSGGFLSRYMHQIRATIDGVTYTGRSGGHGMIFRGRRAAR